MRSAQEDLTATQRGDQAVVAGALALACFSLLLLYRHSRSHGRIAKLTARRTIDAKVQETRRLESLGLLAGGVAHDFNNLLVGVIGNADLARELVLRDSPARECIDEISAAALRCAELSRQMLAYCGRGRLRLEPTDLNSLIEVVAGEVRAKLPAGAELRWDRTNLPPVEIDAVRIRQVLTHVMANASEALGPSGGAIVVRTSVRHFERADLERLPWHEGLREGRYVIVDVSDDGCGMDEHTLARVFDPFFTTKSDSRGFGLAVASGLVRAHKGSVLAESAPGGGTTVHILLPLDEPSSERPAIDVDYRGRAERNHERRRATG